MGLDKKEINSERVLDLTRQIVKETKQKGLTCVIGGTIGIRSIPFIEKLSEEGLDRYETRKVCFACKEALVKYPEKGINRALDFELLWLQNKQNYYRSISEEDQKRIDSLKERGR
jgi:hypothetical protein